ncbi:MAG: hypothetical protein JW700_02280 [Candidatus Aenigmarchaeota archaeon]|nr:hypothetical protein [Candidatus Aenigmarchaeota archaeon]
MKGILISITQAVIISIIGMLVLISMIQLANESFEDKTTDVLSRYNVYKPYVFDINDLIVDPNDPDVLDIQEHTDYYSGYDSPFCEDLRRCIETNIKGGEFCLIKYSVVAGSEFKINDLLNAISRCPSRNVNEKIYGKTESNVERKICKFSPTIKYNELREDDIRLDDYQPDIHGCYLPKELGSLNVLDDVNSVNYLFSGRGTSEGYKFENGGTVRILVTNVSIKKDYDASCSYSLYVCGQNAIATSLDETAVEVFKKVRNLDESNLYYNENIVWNGEPKDQEADIKIWALCRAILSDFVGDLVCGSRPSVPNGYNIYGYNPHYFEFDFSSSLPHPEFSIIDSIDAGMWEWNRINIDNNKKTSYFRSEYWPTIEKAYFSYSPIKSTDIGTNTLSFDSECWNDYYETSNIGERTQIFDNDLESFAFSPSLSHKFQFDKTTVGERIKIVLGLKKIFITKKPMTFYTLTETIETSILEEVIDKYDLKENFEPRTILVMDPITICSE